MRSGANLELNGTMALRRYKMFNPEATRAHVEECAATLKDESAVAQKEIAAVRKMDAESSHGARVTGAIKLLAVFR